MEKNNLLTYINERFPIPGVLLISVIVALSTASIPRPYPGSIDSSLIFLVMVAFAAILLRQRITDEFKDKHHDDVNFPTRPFQRGIIDRTNLIILGIIALLTEMAAVLLAGGIVSLIWYMPVLLYSIIMAKDFFCSQWLEKHFTLYFVLHEIIFIFYAIWLCSVFDANISVETFAWIVFFINLLISIEIGRKFTIRKDPKGRVVKDTYIAVWGRETAVIVISIQLMIAGIALSYVKSTIVFALISAFISLFIHLFSRSNIAVKTVIVIHSLLLILSGALL
ncbi:MAG: hypothetical protein AAB395_04290 [Patescibacteria group bacterium]